MTNVPHAIVDFAAALKMLAEAQSDIAEIITKWDLICNTTTPQTIKIELSDGIHQVDNLAKIREDLVKGLSLDNPSVYSLALKTKYGPASGMLTSTYFWSKSWFASDSDAQSAFHDKYEKYESYWGIYRNMRNTFYSCCMAQKATIEVSLLELARVIWCGYPASKNDAPIAEYNFYLKAPSVNTTVLAQGRQYCTLVTFVSARTNQEGTAAAGAVTLHLYHSDDNRQVETLSIDYGKTATFLMWAAAGQNQVNLIRVHEQEFSA